MQTPVADEPGGESNVAEFRLFYQRIMLALVLTGS